eukprot:TRINITY_DN17403_c0_g1_i1.p1 TRINITY_DN17403_c0_g1~~TRINITY_DN17403_c0_g1_i1.p1  ORF type:complete len:300 (+),score=80.52 TRINITY_DN17403_c0_g1_i1:68-967(+)
MAKAMKKDSATSSGPLERKKVKKQKSAETGPGAEVGKQAKQKKKPKDQSSQVGEVTSDSKQRNKEIYEERVRQKQARIEADRLARKRKAELLGTPAKVSLDAEANKEVQTSRGGRGTGRGTGRGAGRGGGCGAEPSSADKESGSKKEKKKEAWDEKQKRKEANQKLRERLHADPSSLTESELERAKALEKVFLATQAARDEQQSHRAAQLEAKATGTELPALESKNSLKKKSKLRKDGDWDCPSCGALEKRAGDWDCPSCGAMVFASRTSCFKCGAAKPGVVSARGRGRGGSTDRGRGR